MPQNTYLLIQESTTIDVPAELVPGPEAQIEGMNEEPYE